MYFSFFRDFLENIYQKRSAITKKKNRIIKNRKIEKMFLLIINCKTHEFA